MDSQKDKLKNRLNIKFEPIHNYQQSLKKIETLRAKEKPNHDDSIIGSRQRSTSQVRLPSLSKNQNMKSKKTLPDDSTSKLNISEIREKAKSMKQIPKVKVESKEGINNTITYLMKKQILTVPMIIAMLQKNKSQEFLYMKVVGMYEYEACEQKKKGPNYVTVSKNGMVMNGELVALETLARECELYKKLIKIDYFNYFSKIKYLGMWKEGSKKARFVQCKKKITKLLDLNDQKLIFWKIELFNDFQISTKGGWLKEGWVHSLVDGLKDKKVKCQNNLVDICYRMLEEFELPISASTTLMNRVLGNLNALSISFEKKIRIQRQIQKFYRLGRQYQLIFIQKIGFFIITHLNTILNNVVSGNDHYDKLVLTRLQELDIFRQDYNRKRDQILIDSAVALDLDFTLYFDNTQEKIRIKPAPMDIYRDIMAQVRLFIKLMERVGFKLVRTEGFKFITNIVNRTKTEEPEDDNNQFRNYVLSIPAYSPACQILQQTFQLLEETFQRRLDLLKQFQSIYIKFYHRSPDLDFNYEDLASQQKQIETAIQFCEKLNEGEYLIFGFLTFLTFKNQLLEVIKGYQNRFLKTIPIKMNEVRAKLIMDLRAHIEIISISVKNPFDFIKVSNEVQLLDDKMLEYSSILHDLERIQNLYEKIAEVELPNLSEEKKNLYELKGKVKIFKESRDFDFLQHRKKIEVQKQELMNKIKHYQRKEDQFYNPQSPHQSTYTRIHVALRHQLQLKNQLNRLNQLENFYNLKVTVISILEINISEYESLQELWKTYNHAIKDEEDLIGRQVKKINPSDYSKNYEQSRKKIERYLKDQDLAQLGKMVAQKIQKLLQSLQIVAQINTEYLRPQDLAQINHVIERENKLNVGTIKSRQMAFIKIISYQTASLRSQIAQVTFKAKKEIEIQDNLSKFDSWWRNIKLQGETLDDYPLVFIFAENHKIRDQIDEQMTVLLNILNHKYGTFARNTCQSYLRNMNNLIEMLELTIIHQQKFLDLYPILTSKYAQKQLGTETTKFFSILNKTMKNVRHLARPTENLNESTRNLLHNHIKVFDSISKVLSKFLQKKRIKFQRFYFLPDDQLMSVLVGIAGQSNIFRMFDGIKGWLKNEDGIKVGVVGVGEEQLTLRGWTYKSTSEPQTIFKNLQQSIKSNLVSIVRNILYQYEIEMKDLKDLYKGVPWMCVYAVELILYTKQVQLNCLSEGIALEAQESLLREAISQAANKPTHYSNYITLLLYLLNFTETMRKDQVESPFDFQWNSFLRFYYEKDMVEIRALGSQITWGGEYQGRWNLMVNTSDIQRAHICVLSSLQQANGVLLQGPSGTGKTQSLKQLARIAGKYCVVFNCSQSVNIKTLSKMLSGLCYTASWLCLDQINRLSQQAMSSVASQISSIRNAILNKKEVFNFMGKDIKLKKGVGIFATMNPIYMKRAKLTENMKSYFRVITVAIPDYQKILQVQLYGLNFNNPGTLAKMIGNIFKNLSVQLSHLNQYDFGLRAMKFLLINLEIRKKQGQDLNDLLQKAFSDTYISRLSKEDEEVFKKVVSDTLKTKVQNQINLSMQDRIRMIESAPQTGVIVFGPPSSKSNLINRYCERQEQKQIHIFNPSSIDLRYFLGQSLHGRWQQGIIEKIARISLQKTDTIQILKLDSTLKSQIIENFNTLLDESKILTLSNGTRLKIQDNFKIIMQTPHLNYTSPATVTRCFIQYINDHDVIRRELITAQLPRTLSQSPMAKRIIALLDKYSNQEIRMIGKLFKIIISSRLLHFEGQWQENQVLGVEKALIFSAKILGLQKNIQDFIHKDNSLSNRKSPFRHILSYSRYIEGEFVEIGRTSDPVIWKQKIFINTAQMSFCSWLTQRSIKRVNTPLLWKGLRGSGKTTAIELSLYGQKYTKIPINPLINSLGISKLILPQMLQKKEDEVYLHPVFNVYLQDLHMGSEQVLQNFRFIIQNQKTFSTVTKDVVQIQPFAVVGQKSQSEKTDKSRIWRHFAEIEMPIPDHIEVKSIYSQMIKSTLNQTNALTAFKTLVQIEVQKFSVFVDDYRIKLSANLPSAQFIQPFCMIPIFNCVKKLSQKNKEVQDFISLMFHELRVNQTFFRDTQLQTLHVAYHQAYKMKYSKQAEKCLKKQGYLSTMSTSPGIIKSWKDLESSLKENMPKQGAYISEYILLEIANCLQILQNNHGAHYCLIGNSGQGKTKIMEHACQVNKSDFIHLESSLLEKGKQIRKIYYKAMKKGFQTKIPQVIIVELDLPGVDQFFSFIQMVTAGYQATQLFENQDTDYMFSSISDYSETFYEKNTKSYEEICQDYMLFAHNYVRIFMLATPQSKIKQILGQFLHVQKRTAIRKLPAYPVESIVQIIVQILQKDSKGRSSFEDKISILSSIFLKIHKILLQQDHRMHFNGDKHFNHTHLHTFKIVQLFIANYDRTFYKIKQHQEKLHRSIVKISEAYSTLERLKSDIEEMEPKIKEKQRRIYEVVPILQEKKKGSKTIKYVIQQEKQNIKYQREQLQLMMNQMQQQISQAQPNLTRAIDSVQTIKRSDLSEIKNNTNPHPLIKFTLENMVLLLGENESWDSVKKALSDPNLLVRIKNCKPTYEAYLSVKKRMSGHPEWTFDAVAKISYGTRYLYRWIVNMVEYQDMKSELQKKKGNVDKLKTQLAESEQKAEQKMRQLNKKEEAAMEIQRQYGKVTKQLNDLEEQLESNKKKLKNAQSIKYNLGTSLQKWEKQLEYLKETKRCLEYYSIMLSVEIKSLAALTPEQSSKLRAQIEDTLKKSGLPFPKQIDLISDITTYYLDDNTVSKAAKQCNERQKILLAYHFKNKPLIYDPDDQAIQWLQSANLGQKICFSKKSFANAYKVAEDAMKNGDILIAYIDGTIDSFTADLIKSIQSCSEQNRYLAEYNKNLFYLHQDFVLILCCNKKSCAINSMASLDHQVINFEISKNSLQQQLLKLTLMEQNPHLFGINKQIEQTVVQINKTIQSMEEVIIEALVNNRKNIIEDGEFVDIVNKNRSKIEYFKANQEHQQQSMLKVKEHYELFSPMVTEASEIYVKLKQLNKINTFLVWNIDIFLQYFLQALNDSISLIIINEKPEENIQNQAFVANFEFEQVDPVLSRPNTSGSIGTVTFSDNNEQEKPIVNDQQSEQQIVINLPQDKFENLMDDIQKIPEEHKKGKIDNRRHREIIQNLLNSIKKCLTNQQRSTLGLLLILKNQNKEHIKCLLNLSKPQHTSKSLKQLMGQNMMTDTIKSCFENIDDNLEVFVKNLLSDRDLWYKFKEKLTLTDFLILTSVLMPTSFVRTVEYFITIKGYSCIFDYDETKVSDWLRKSKPNHPILLMMGEDPISTITEFLSQRRYRNVTLIAMGDEQGKSMQGILQKESKKQGILIIHNLHIGVNFLSYLSRFIQQFKYRSPHPKFRLILISSSTASIPAQISSTCHKYLIQQPAGIKNKLKNLYKKSELYVDHSLPSHNKITYSLCLMHGIVTQLQSFGNLGWSAPPNFTTDDFVSAILNLRTLGEGKKDVEIFRGNIDRQQMEENQKHEIDFEGLRYMVGQINYIGKMADNLDRQKMRIIVSKHLQKLILNKNFHMWQGSRLPQNPSQVLDIIEEIPQRNPKFYGLNEGAQPINQKPQIFLSHLTKILTHNPSVFDHAKPKLFQQVQPINHKLAFVNSQISQYNQNSVYEQTYPFLKEIKTETKEFNLKAFNNPRQFFISVKMDMALKQNVPYQSVTLSWSFIPKENSYGVADLLVEGGNIQNGMLVDGMMEKPITIYFNPVVKKKDKDPNKGKVPIPLYRNSQRSGAINSYGENTNLLVHTYLDSKEAADVWTVRGTAFIVA